MRKPGENELSLYGGRTLQLAAIPASVAGISRTMMFLSQGPTQRRLLKPGAVLVLFEWNNFFVPHPRPGVWKRRERPAADDDTPNEEAIAIPGDHDYISAPDPAVVDLALEENTSLREEILKLRTQIKKLMMKQRFGIHRFAGSDSDFHFFSK